MTACTICQGTGSIPLPCPRCNDRGCEDHNGDPAPCTPRADECDECYGTGKASCSICGVAVDTADRWTCCAPVLADGRWTCHGCDGQPSIPSVAVVTP